MLAVFGVLIFEMNKRATTYSDANVEACKLQIDVCESYATAKDDFSSVLSALPTKAIQFSSTQITKLQRDGNKSVNDYEQIAQEINQMDTADKLRSVIVKLVCAAKDPNMSDAVNTSLYWTALQSMKWKTLEKGTEFSRVVLCFQ